MPQFSGDINAGWRETRKFEIVTDSKGPRDSELGEFIVELGNLKYLGQGTT